MLYLSFPIFLLFSFAYVTDIVTGIFIGDLRVTIEMIIALGMPIFFPSSFAQN